MSSQRTGGVSRRGFTLLEVMICSFLMVMVLAGAYSVIIRAMSLSKVARNHYVAATIAKNRLERARNFPYADLKLLSETNLVVNDNGVPDFAGSFRRSTLVNTNASVVGGLTEVTITVQIKNLKTGSWTKDVPESIKCDFTYYPP